MGGGLGGGMRALLVLLTALLAASLPLRYILAWASPDMASVLGIPFMRRLPTATLVILSVSIAAHALLMIVVVKEVWQLAGLFRSGIFFSRSTVTRIRKISLYLLLTSALGIAAFVLAICSVSFSGHAIRWSNIWLQCFNLPIGTLVCGLLSLAMAQAFDQARKMASENRFTV